MTASKIVHGWNGHLGIFCQVKENCRQNLDYEQSHFFLGPSSKTLETRKWPRAWLKAQDGRGTRLFFLLGLPPSFLASRGFAAQRSRARALPLLNLKKKRDCSQSRQNLLLRTDILQKTVVGCPWPELWKTTIGLIAAHFFVHFLAFDLHDYNVKRPETSCSRFMEEMCYMFLFTFSTATHFF